MRKRLSWMVMAVLMLSLVLQAFPLSASVLASGGGEAALRIEGEQYTSVNQTPVAKAERDSLRGASTELSGNDFLFFKSAAGVALPTNGYIAEYQINIAAAGTYSLEIMASPIGMGHVSPYQIKINDGGYMDVNTSIAAKIRQIASPVNLFYQYRLTPVTLQEGVNTISFRIQNGRQSDGRIYFFLDYLELTKLPWGLDNITANAPNHLFEEGDGKEVTVHFTDSASQGHTLSYKVEDYSGAVVLQNSVTLTSDVPSYTFPLTGLERGHYTVTAEADGNGAPLQEYVSVVMNAAERRSVEGSPFAMDMAAGSLIPASEAGQYARAVRLTGVEYVRERMHWNSVSSESGIYNFGKYDPYNQAYADNGIRVLELNHIAPAWSKDSGKNLPRSLLDAYDLAKASVQHYGAQADWEFWNEPDIQYTADSEPADQYAAFLKATAIAARDSGVDTSVALAGIAYPPGSYMELLMQNDAALYMDAYNYHAHRNDNESLLVPDVPPSFASHTEFIRGYGLEGKPVYVTEAGISQKFAAGSQTLTAGQLRLQARYLAASTIQSIASGVDKHFWFVFPHYLENGMSWGSFSSRGTPYASINAQAAMTYVLGEAVYLGQLPGLPKGVKSYVFRDGTDSVAAYWSETDIPFTAAAGSADALLTDIMGTEQQVSPVNGSLALVSGPDVHYLRIAGDFPGLSAPAYGAPAPHAAELTAAKRVVLAQTYPEAAASQAKAKGYRLDKTAVTEIQVEVYNFNSAPMSGAVTGSAYGGWSLAVPSQPVTVAPYSRTVLTFALTGSAGVAADVKAPVVFQGMFAGEATSKSVTLVASDENLPAAPSLLVPDYDQPSLWQTNISDGSTSAITSPQEGEIRFDYSFGSGDKWSYPNFTLPPGVDFAGTEGLAFEVYFEAPIDGVVIRSFMYEQNGSGYFTAGGIAPTGGWQQIKMPWADFAAFGTPDDNFHLDPDQIRRFAVGINSRTAAQASFRVRNLGVYTQPDTGLYSRISGLTPAHGQQVAAGAVEIAASLVQGEIPVPEETVEVLVDGAAVSSQVHHDGSITALAVLTPGSHTITVKAFDVNGRLVTVGSTVDATAE